MSPPSRVTPAVRKVATLWVHNASFSKDEILFNAAYFRRDPSLTLDGHLLKILPHHADDSPAHYNLSRSRHVLNASSSAAAHSQSSAFVFVARDLTEEQRARHPNLQISVSEAIASCHGFRSRMQVLLVAAERDEHAASHVEIHFKDPLSRDDLWKVIVAQLHRRQCLYEGQKITYLGNIEFTVRKVYVNGQKAASAIFTDQSKPIFRSLAARYVVGVQLSEEVWDFDQYSTCEIRWIRLKTFLLELFERWNTLGAKHTVTLFFFTRLHYPSSAESGSSSEDFYRVVASELASANCASLHERLDEEFRSFLKDVEQHHAVSAEMSLPTLKGSPTSARNGNLLEAVNLAASASLHDDIDLDFVRTGTLILMLTAGPAVFDVQEELLRVTCTRLIMRQIGVELVSMASPPPHVAPLFMLHNSTDGPWNGVVRLDATPPKSVIPSWVETSFYEGPKRKPANATKYLSFAQEHEANGFQQSQPLSTLSAASIDTEAKYLQLSRLSAQRDTSDRNSLDGFLHAAQAHDHESFVTKLAVADSTKLNQERVSPTASFWKTANTRAVSGLSSQLSQISGRRPSRGSPEKQTLSVLPQSQRRRKDLSQRSRPTAQRVKFIPGEAGPLYAKASATVGPTLTSVQSSSNIGNSRSRPSQGRQASLASQLRASLQRKTSSHSLESHNSSTHSKSLITSEETSSGHVSTPSINDPHGQGTLSPAESPIAHEEQSLSEPANFFSAASSYSKRAKLAVGHPSGPKVQASSSASDDLPWCVVESPLKPQRMTRRAFGEWNHVFTRQIQAYALKWKALVTPASLPLTTEDFPSWAQLQASFAESPYRVALSEYHAQDHALSLKQAHLARELVQARISDGFQIAVGRKAREITGAEDIDLYAADLMGQEGAAVLLVRGDDIQRLTVSAGDVAVTRFQRRKPPGRAIHYRANIRTAFEQEYSVSSLSFDASEERNWNDIDNQIASHEMDGTEDGSSPAGGALTLRRARFVLIPVSPGTSLSATGSGNEDSDEEIRIEGIRKMTMLWQKNRWHPPSRQRHKASWTAHTDLNPLAIEYHTRDPSAVVAAGLESMNEGDQTAATTQLFNPSESYRTSNVDLQDLAAELQSERGIRVKTRRWHFRAYEYCFIGMDLTTFLTARFQDISSRDEAVEFGNLLLKKKLFHHVHSKHTFRDGQYFYTIAEEYRTPRTEAKGIGWFVTRKEKPATPALIAVDRAKKSPDPNHDPRTTGPKRSKVCLNASLQYNLDARKSSTRMEVITIHYDRLHNPENAFHFEIEWQNATARLVEDALTSWASTIAKFGLKLVQLPVAESARIADINPLRSPYTVKLAVRPPIASIPNVTESPAVLPQQLRGSLPFQKAILRKLDFVLDFEAQSNFPSNVSVTYTWGTPSYEHAQYIHRSGMLLAQIIDDTQFILLANRFYNNRATRGREYIYREKTPEKPDKERRGLHAAIPRTSSALFSHGSPPSSPAVRPVLDLRQSPLLGPKGKGYVTAEALKDKFERFCSDDVALRALYEQVLQQAPLPAERPTPSLSAVSAFQTPLLQASIPSLDIAEEDEGSLALNTRK